MRHVRRREFVQAVFAAPVTAAFSSWAAIREPSPETNPVIHPPKQSFLDTLPRLMELAELPGIGIGIVQGDRLAWQHYAGLANADTKTPITEASIFPAASMGKQVFAWAALQVVQEGKLDLDRPLKEYLEDGAPTGRWSELICARHVLSHSSGLPNWRWEKDQPLTPSFEPGTKFRYSGEGYYYLQRCIEHITGIGAEQFLQDRAMKKAGMNSSTYLWRADAEARLVFGHEHNEPYEGHEFAKKLFAVIQASGKPLASWHHEEIVAAMSKQSPAGSLLPLGVSPNAAFSLLTTVGDYCAFVARIVAPPSEAADVNPALRAQMIRPYSHINSALSWGLGWGIEQEGAGPRFLWQWGNNGRWMNFVLVHPESRSAIVVFSNGENGMRVIERLVRAATDQDHAAFLWV
ncbi:MAG TPA: serine hydrolase domain-containing protein [Candidatus Acidoferrum sp.]|jgi:CubicO group peptidase (beta-lactamase class C family)|nr:serine hydrolase domain-containing protein [Candidatus Acidoferrum sp.]